MRYVNSKGVEGNPSTSYTIWSTGSLPAPNILRTIQNSDSTEVCRFSDDLPSLYSLDAVSPSQKRKILECERGDYDERFNKMQRRKLLKRVAARASLVIDDEASDDEEDEIYEQMDWIEKENSAANMFAWDSSEEEDDDDESFEEIIPNSSLLFVPRFKWKEERRRLLRISMAKIRRVEDPESYLRRSVLINNTVKRLQTDVAMMACHSDPSTSAINYTYQIDHHNSWQPDPNIYSKEQNQEASFDVEYSASVLNSETVVRYDNQSVQPDLSNPVQFHLAYASSFSPDKEFDVARQELLHNTTFNRNHTEDQKLLSEVSFSPIVLKQPSLHLFSSQPCGLQYRSHLQEGDSTDEYNDSPSTSSILDSVVYHSLVASLET